MFRMIMSRGDSSNTVSLHLPTTPSDIGRTFAKLDAVSTTHSTVMTEFNSPVEGLYQYVESINLDSEEEFGKLHSLAERVSTMTPKQCWIFSGALAANSINGIDDVLKVADSLDEYILIPNVNTDVELGRYVAVAGQINADPRFPEEAWPYLDFAKIGAEYYADHGGAYTYGGYVQRKQVSQPEIQKDGALLSLQLETSDRVCVLRLPASEEELDAAKGRLGIEDFAQAKVERIDFLAPYLEEHIPTECIRVEDANDLALSIDEMNQHDGMLLKYLSVLEVCQPETMSEALQYATNIDDYERVPDDPDEYGRSVLRRIGADDELIDTIDGYMDFAALGKASMEEDGVRRTEFGLIRRCSQPFPEEIADLQFGGM